MIKRGVGGLGWALTFGLGLSWASALAAGEPQSILPEPVPTPTPTSTPSAVPSEPAVPVTPPEAVIDEPVMTWDVDDAQTLLGVIEAIGADGLIPADYQPEALRAAIAAGPGVALNEQASRSFAWLVEDMRDGRTRIDARVQWFVVDSDLETATTTALMTQALAAKDVAGVIAGLAPTAPDYAALKALLATTSKADKARRNLIRINMDRWRWLPRELGKFYLLTNVPEYQLRLTVSNEIIRSYRTVVGKPGRTATPQLAEVVEGLILNPTWTVPQSIVKGEGLGAELLANPARAEREGYKVTKGKDGYVSVVQQPGPGNALGLMKFDMPNEHAIFVHDTPARSFFNLKERALSHGCIRADRARELVLTMAILGAGMKTADTLAILDSKEYTKVAMTRTFPIYIMYFTMASDITGKMGTFADIYGRDAPVLASFAAPRAPWDGRRKTDEKIIQLDNPL
jgi:murein L,D-transpeptidase YcbB/YkuD